MKTSETSNKHSNQESKNSFITSPLRNRIQLQLSRPVSEVWALVGDPGKMPEYSSGLQAVETKKDRDGSCTEYTCHFKPLEQGQSGIIHRSKINWYEQNKGWASIDEEPNSYGLKNSITLITMEPVEEGTLLTWNQHYDAADLEWNKAGFEYALTDIADRLIKRFGGRLIENFVEGKEK